MTLPKLGSAALLVIVCTSARPARAQEVESVGSRALGMGGAFVAVANDSSATWWNAGALGSGPFLDLALARAVESVDTGLPAARHTATWLAVGTPPVGFGYYRLRVTDARRMDSTDADDGGREDGGAAAAVRSLAASQIGVTLVQTLFPGVHAGTTLKYVRGIVRTAREGGDLAPSALLDRGDDLGGGEARGRFDLDIGLLAVAGPFSLGLAGRNLREPRFDAADGSVVRLERQVRVGAAYSGERVGASPLTVAIDADLREYGTLSGPRRAVAIGAEQWLFSRRLAVRGGARLNMIGRRERVGAGGLSVAARAGLYLDGYVSRGAESESGWGVAVRVSF